MYLIFNEEILDLILGHQIRRNNVLIRRLTAPWVTDDVQLSIYADIFRCLDSDDIFGQCSIFSSIPLVITRCDFAVKNHRNFCHHHLIALFRGCANKVIRILKNSKCRISKILNVPTTDFKTKKSAM